MIGLSTNHSRTGRMFSRTDQSIVGQWWWTVDRVLLSIMLALAGIGIVMVVTGSPPVAERLGLDQYYFFKRHMVFLVPSLLAMVGLSMCSHRTIWRIASVILAGSILCMAFVLVAGAEVKGAQRWIHLPFGSIQPSEFAKPAFAVVIAWFMARQKDQPGFPGDRLAAGLYALLISLLILQPDFGMSMLVTAIIVGQVFLAGLPLRLVVGLGGVAALGGVGAYFGLHHVRSRIDRFLNPETGDTYQIDLARQAFQEGGAFGAGPGQGTVKLAIPDAHTDFVFSVAGEEMGLVLLLIIIGLFAWVILRGLNRVMDSDNMFVILGTGGLLTMFGCQSLVHMGSNLALIPTKGMTLPFLSYGGSSLVAVGIGMGFLLALTRRQGRSTIAKGGMAPKTQMNAS